MSPAQPPVPAPRFSHGLARLSDLLHWINALLVLPAILILVLADIVLRRVSDMPLIWSSEVLGLLLLCLFFLELPNAVRQQELLFVDVFYHQLPRPLQRCITPWVWSLLGLAGLLLGGQGVLGAWELAKYEEGALTLAIPFWPFSLLIGLSGLLVTLQSLHALLGQRRLAGYTVPPRE